MNLEDIFVVSKSKNFCHSNVSASLTGFEVLSFKSRSKLILQIVLTKKMQVDCLEGKSIYMKQLLPP